MGAEKRRPTYDLAADVVTEFTVMSFKEK